MRRWAGTVHTHCHPDGEADPGVSAQLDHEININKHAQDGQERQEGNLRGDDTHILTAALVQCRINTQTNKKIRAAHKKPNNVRPRWEEGNCTWSRTSELQKQSVWESSKI